MKTYTYRPQGVCSRKIEIDLDDDNVILAVRFEGGCSGNTQGVSRLAVGRPADEVIGILRGIRCGFKATSCPDQLSRALSEAISK